MDSILDRITEFIKEGLQGWVLANLDTMFTDVNDKVSTIAGEVARTPSAWNAGVSNMIKNLSNNVMVPIGGMIISFILVYELINLIIDKNNMHEIDTSLFIRFFIKACIAVSILSQTFDIVMAVFDVGSNIVTNAGGLISSSTSINVGATLISMFSSSLSTMEIGELISLGMETMIVSMCMKIMSVLITVVLYKELCLTIDKIQDREGKIWIPLYTDEEEIDKGVTPNVRINIEIFEILMEAVCYEESNGLVINPFGKSINIPKDVVKDVIDAYCKMLKDKPID